MSADLHDQETDFGALMQKLASEAQRLPTNTSVKKPGEKPVEVTALDLVEMLKPMAEGIQALGRAVVANTNALAVQAEQQRQLPDLLSALNSNLDDRKAVSKKLFDALHEELRGYKDAFLFEALQKPMVRDLILLYDDLSKLHQQFCSMVQDHRSGSEGHAVAESLLSAFEKMLTSIDHATHVVLEILNRLEVERMAPRTGKLDKLVQQAVLVEPAETADQDGEVVRSIRPGFTWRGRLVRPEEVVIRKFKASHSP